MRAAPVFARRLLETVAASTPEHRAATHVRIAAPWLTARAYVPASSIARTASSKRPRNSCPLAPPGITVSSEPVAQAEATPM
jgi:hypothetical protein